VAGPRFSHLFIKGFSKWPSVIITKCSVCQRPQQKTRSRRPIENSLFSITRTRILGTRPRRKNSRKPRRHTRFWETTRNARPMISSALLVSREWRELNRTILAYFATSRTFSADLAIFHRFLVRFLAKGRSVVEKHVQITVLI